MVQMDHHVKIEAGSIELTDKVKTFYESEIKSHGNSVRASLSKNISHRAKRRENRMS